MKKTLLTALSLSVIVACGPKTETEEASATVETETSEWISLFDGESFTGWTKYGGAPVGKAWQVQDGAIYLDATNKDDWQVADGGDIVTEEEFEDFHLKLEWKIAKNGNSGIMIYVHESEEYPYPWSTGPEMQVLDNDGHPDAKIETHRAGDLYDLIASSSEPVKPVGEWNLAEIVSQDGKLDFYLNGVNIVSTTMWTPEWEEMIAGSKFKDMPGFGTFKKGKIALQDHGDEVWYRNIELKKL
ncbi:3-keto-disaccharide hydrolase [Penaeicola halotolerans]|uniref:3-keto-disaccharide hydrolase n=1 Tax=Penaeicola halotolerans TaxID=2793196 RepID=UPI001CF84E0C|nr:DUF1080 domain-containing protein [Penaeicola halotolerans]